MNKLPQHLEDLLQRYLDGDVTAGEREKIERMVSADATVAKRLNEISTVHKFLQQQQLPEPSNRFTMNVMASLDQRPQTSLPSIRNGVFLLMGVFIVVFIAIALSSAGAFNDTTTVDLNQLNLAQRVIRQHLPTVSIDGKLVVNIIILLNIAIAFVVLDRAILKPIFQRRIQSPQ